MRLLLPFLIACLSGTALAQAPEMVPDSTVRMLSEVVIAENRVRIPFSEANRHLTLVTRDELRQAPVQDVTEALRYVPGVDVRQRGPGGAQADLSIRGGSFEQSLVLINGIKFTDPQTGHHLLNLPLNVDNVERIEVLKGPGARIFGRNAFAGAVNIITRIPDRAALYLDAYGGDFSTYGFTSALALPGERYGQYMSISRDVSGGYRPNSDYQINNAFYQSTLPAGRGAFNLLAGYSDRAFGAGGFYVPNSTEFEQVKTGLLSVDYTLETGNWFIRPRVYARRNDDAYVLRREDPDFFRNFHTTRVVNAEVNAGHTTRLGQTGFGVETVYEDIRSTNLGDHERRTVGGFAEQRFRLGRLAVTPGVYVEWNSDYGWRSFPGIDAGYALTPTLRAYANAGSSFRVPTYTDLFYTSPRTENGPGTIGNPDLEPEQAFTTEVGLRWLRGDLLAEANYFRRSADRLIEWVRPAGAPDSIPWQPRNFFEVVTQGVELMAAWQPAQPTKSAVQRLSLSYNYLQSELESAPDVQSRYVLSQLRHQLIGQVDHQLLGRFTHHLRARYAERLGGDRYAVLDSRVAWTSGPLRLYVEATNLTNADYVEAGFVPMPGRWLRGGVAWRIGLED